MFRKFFDPAAAEAKAEPRFQLGEPITLEQMMEGEGDNKKEEVKPEVKEEKQPEVKIEEKKVEEVKVEQKPEVKVEEKKEPVVVDWREEAKKNPKEALALLGIDEDAHNFGKEVNSDDFVKKLVAYRKEHGNVTPFIEAATRDWDKVSHVDLIKDELKKQYSSMQKDKAEKLVNADYASRFTYKDNPDLTEAENAELAELTLLRLESEGEKIRASRKTEQTQFLDSVKPVDKAAVADKLSAEQQKREQAEQQDALKFKTAYENHPDAIKLATEKKIVLGQNADSFNYTVNPDAIKEQAVSFKAFDDQFWPVNENGQPFFDVKKWNKVSAYAQNPEAFETALINHGRSLGSGAVVEDLENKKEPGATSKTEIKTPSLAKTFMEKGEVFTMDQMQ